MLLCLHLTVYSVWKIKTQHLAAPLRHFASQPFTSMSPASHLSSPSLSLLPLHHLSFCSTPTSGQYSRHKYQQQGFVTELPLNCCFVCFTWHGLFPGENAFQYGKCYWLRYESPVFSLQWIKSFSLLRREISISKFLHNGFTLTQ